MHRLAEHAECERDGIHLFPGEFVASERSLAERWRWTKTTVHRFLAELFKDQRLDQRRTTLRSGKWTILKLVKWEEQQGKFDEREISRTSKRTTPRTKNGPPQYKDRARDTLNINNTSPKGLVDPPTPLDEFLGFPENLKTPECLRAWKEWLAYKQARGEVYKSELTATKQLKKWGVVGAERFVAAIDESIASNWAGIFEPKGTLPTLTTPGSSSSPTLTRPLDYTERKLVRNADAKREGLLLAQAITDMSPKRVEGPL